MKKNRYHFQEKLFPIILIMPQVVVTIVFFLLPSIQAIIHSFYIQDPFGLSIKFSGIDNFLELFKDKKYFYSFKITLIFSVLTVFFSFSLSLIMAVVADRITRYSRILNVVFTLPYAVAPAISGIIWLFVFRPSAGIMANFLEWIGLSWDPLTNGVQAMVIIVIASVWKQTAYNFIFFLAALQSIPKSILESASIDGAGNTYIFWSIKFPLMAPTTFFLLVINIIYVLFETFGIIHTMTSGGPGKDTETLIYKIFNDGFIGLDIGASSAQSLILMLIVIFLTIIQFRYVERRVHY